MILVQGSYQILTWNGAVVSSSRMFDTSTNSNANTRKIINIILLQAIPPNMATLQSLYFSHEQQPLTMIKLPIVSILKDSNEILLLNLTKKMEEMAINMAKDKEKKHKPTNTKLNV